MAVRNKKRYDLRNPLPKIALVQPMKIDGDIIPEKQPSAAGRGDDDAWGKSKDNSDAETIGWNKAGSSNQNGDSGGWDASASNWKKSADVDGRHSDEWSKEKDPATAQDRSWGKSEGNGEGQAWNKVGTIGPTWQR